MRTARHLMAVCVWSAIVATSVRAELLLFACSNPPAAYFGLYTMKDDGTGIKPFITNQPAWAPGIAENGFDLAFVNPGQAASNIYLTTVYGAPPVNVPITNKAFTARCFGASDVLFLARRTANSYQLWRVGRDGSGERPVLATTFSVFPVGIEAFDVDSAADHAYVCGAGPSGMTLWRITVSNGTAVNLAITTNYYGDHYNPALSRDKTRLAYIADFYEGSHRAVVSPAQIAATAFVNVTTVYCGNPAWSRGGGEIAYTKAYASTFGSRSYVGYIAKTATNGIAEVNLTTNTICANRCAFPQYFTKPTTWHVSADGDDNNTGASWAAPLRTMQKAVDLAEAGNTIIVSNGVYAEGGRRRVATTCSNRVFISKPVLVQSLSGPAHTAIIGGPDPLALGNGSNAVRCALVTNGATLIGFMLSNGYVASSGTIYDRMGGGALLWQGGMLSNCIVTGCGRDAGAIACNYGGRVLNCVISNNSGTGIVLYNGNALASNCLVAGNVARGSAGGVSVWGASLLDCRVVNNVASNSGDGGGVTASEPALVDRCLISGNWADSGGGGMLADGANTIVRSCQLDRNYTRYNGGGVYVMNEAGIYNCTIVSNEAGDLAGGVYVRWGGTNVNCIITGNSAPTNANYGSDAGGGTFAHCCTVPDANALAGCYGNITNAPQLYNPGDGRLQLAADSPCINSGTNMPWMLTALDLDGNPRILPAGGVVDMGAYEYVPEPARWGMLALFAIFKLQCTMWQRRREK